MEGEVNARDRHRDIGGANRRFTTRAILSRKRGSEIEGQHSQAGNQSEEGKLTTG